MKIPKLSHPRPERRREHWINLNGTWEFSLDAPTYDRRITVPYSWASPLSGIGENKQGTGYYRRRVSFPLSGGLPYLVIGAVDYECEVSLNGQLLATHIGGYLPVEVDLSPAWQEGENLLEIKARDAEVGGQIRGKQAYGEIRGIWQTVYIEERPRVHLRDIFVRTFCDGRVIIDCTPSAREEGLGYTASFAGMVATNDDDGRITLELPAPRLWTPEDPYLYEGSIALESEEGTDTVYTYFGIREVGTEVGEDGIARVTLNREPLYLQGVLDQGFHPEGYFTLPEDSDCEEEILRVKRLGLNTVRFHAKCEEPLKLYYADRHGLLVLQDFPAYWGDASEARLAEVEATMTDAILRDRNHPAIIQWIVFNESWGIRTTVREGEGGTKMKVLPETEPWVRRLFYLAKALDPTRLVEDNSPCLHDHIVTDINSWHFYEYGYEPLAHEVATRAALAHRGSGDNFIPPYVQGDQPLLCSECGFVWGVDGGAGDCDLAWHYKMMINEFRRTPRLTGFIYTQLHDVVNEFNGYYRIDNVNKTFGYEDICEGMSLSELHSEAFLTYEGPPFRVLLPGEEAAIPLSLSIVSTRYARRALRARYRFVALLANGRRIPCGEGELGFTPPGIGLFPIGTATATMPRENATVILTLTLAEGEHPLMHNFTVLDVPAERPDAYTLPLSSLTASGFDRTFTCIGGEKWNGLGAGSVSFTLRKRELPSADDGSFVLRLEASARPTFPKDRRDAADPEIVFNGDNPIHPLEKRNSFPMTDEAPKPCGRLTVKIGEVSVCENELPPATCDCRGTLSHGYQPNPRRIDEDGSYGRLIEIRVDAATAAALGEEFCVCLASKDGLSLFGRGSGRYPTGIAVTAE